MCIMLISRLSETGSAHYLEHVQHVYIQTLPLEENLKVLGIDVILKERAFGFKYFMQLLLCYFRHCYYSQRSETSFLVKAIQLLSLWEIIGIKGQSQVPQIEHFKVTQTMAK